MSRYQVVPFAISANFGWIFPRKSTQVKIHSKMAIFWLVFSSKNPVKSDKLALIEGKILNLMFFDINIPVVPIEIWLRVTHNQRQKTLKVASVLLFRHILKTKSWLECGFSLLNSRMWPGILRDDNTHAYSTFINCLRNVELVQCETQLNNYANTDLLARLDGRMRLRGVYSEKYRKRYLWPSRNILTWPEYDLNRLLPREVGSQNFKASLVKAPLYHL